MLLCNIGVFYGVILSSFSGELNELLSVLCLARSLSLLFLLGKNYTPNK